MALFTNYPDLLKTTRVGLAALAIAGMTGASFADVVLVREGQPEAVIVVSSKPTRSAQVAAYELQDHIRVMSGAELRIQDENQPLPAGIVPIYVGESGPTRLQGLISVDFPIQASLARVTADAVVLIGRDDNDFGPVDYAVLGAESGLGSYARVGTLYAVYDFLEKECGVRWYMPTDLGRVVPTRKTLTVPLMERPARPWTRYRRLGYASQPDPMDPGVFDTKKTAACAMRSCMSCVRAWAARRMGSTIRCTGITSVSPKRTRSGGWMMFPACLRSFATTGRMWSTRSQKTQWNFLASRSANGSMG